MNNQQETPKYTFDMVWQMFAETNKMFAETDKKLNKIAEKLEKTDRIVNGIAKSNGLVAEQTIFNSLERDMTFAGIGFHDIERNRRGKSKRHNIEGEFDVVLTNGDVVALIETKHKVRKEDVIKFATTQIDNFRKLYPMYDKYKIILGVGGMSFEAEQKKKQRRTASEL